MVGRWGFRVGGASECLGAAVLSGIPHASVGGGPYKVAPCWLPPMDASPSLTLPSKETRGRTP